jgi:hypothetical protein
MGCMLDKFHEILLRSLLREVRLSARYGELSRQREVVLEAEGFRIMSYPNASVLDHTQ